MRIVGAEFRHADTGCRGCPTDICGVAQRMYKSFVVFGVHQIGSRNGNKALGGFCNEKRHKTKLRSRKTAETVEKENNIGKHILFENDLGGFFQIIRRIGKTRGKQTFKHREDP